MSETPAAPAAQAHLPERVLLNGTAAAEVSALDRGLHYGDGLFETIACTGGAPRLLKLHLRRLGVGCARLGLEADLEAVAREVRTLAAESARAIVKVLITRGPALARGYAAEDAHTPTRVALRYAWAQEDPARALQGVRVRLAQLRLGENPALAGLKHLNRLEQVLARAEWRGADIAEALMFSSGGALISGTMSNVFLARAGTLVTPRLDRCGVRGVMREVVMREARGAGLALEERVLGEGDLKEAEELFLTNALIGIRPVCELEGRPLAVGPLTRRLQERLATVLAAGAPSSRGRA